MVHCIMDRTTVYSVQCAVCDSPRPVIESVGFCFDEEIVELEIDKAFFERGVIS